MAYGLLIRGGQIFDGNSAAAFPGNVAVKDGGIEEIREGVFLRVIPDALGAKYIGSSERHLPPERRRTR
jgi:N-acyl-D-aspartate/D-glutamate deacylase